jgi:hypothetical protein
LAQSYVAFTEPFGGSGPWLSAPVTFVGSKGCEMGESAIHAEVAAVLVQDSVTEPVPVFEVHVGVVLLNEAMPGMTDGELTGEAATVFGGVGFGVGLGVGLAGGAVVLTAGFAVDGAAVTVAVTVAVTIAEGGAGALAGVLAIVEAVDALAG